MKSKIRSFTAIFLAVIMTAGLCLTASAGNSSPEYSNYVSLGDSLACGYTEAHFRGLDPLNKTSDVAPCWTVARELGIPNVYPATFSGGRSTEILSLLTGEIIYDDYNTADGFFAGSMDPIVSLSAEVQKKVQEADLITLTVGANDILTYSVSYAGLIGKSDISSADVSKLVTGMWKGFENICDHYPKVLARIRQLNDHADVVVTGEFNPLREATLTDSTLLPVGTALTTIIGLLNEQFSYWARQANVLYADISDCDNWFNGEVDGPTSILDSMNTGNILLYVHPTAEGYAYIGRQIAKVLQEQNQKLTTNIRLDLQSIKAKNVTSVLVNGVAVKGFRATGTYTLEIPCSNHLATAVTIVAKDGWKTQTATWYVRWIPGTGYRPTVLARSTNVAQSAAEARTRITDNVTSAVKGILSLFR